MSQLNFQQFVPPQQPASPQCVCVAISGTSSGMSSDQAIFEVLESDLRALSAEARKTDSNLATQITGWLQHTDYAQIKDSAERAVLKLRAISQDGGGLAAVRESKVRGGETNS